MSSPIRCVVVVAVIAACAHGGCNRDRARGVEIDEARFDREVGQRFLAGANRPEAARGFEALVNGIMADPEIARDGGALLGELGADPGLADGLQEMMARVQANPAIQRFITKLVADHPGASPDEIGRLAQDQVARVTSSPAFSRAWSRAWGELIADPDLAQAMQSLGRGVATSPALAAAIQKIATIELDDRVRRRLVELAGGDVPDRERATELLLDHAFSEERCAQFYVTVTSSPAVHRELVAAMRVLVKAPSLRGILVAGARTIIDDPAFRDRADATFALVVDDGVTEDRLYPALHDLLATPSVHRAVADLIAHLRADPDLSSIGTSTIERILADPSITEALRRMAVDW